MAFVRTTTTGQTWNPTASEINSFSNKANSFGRLGEGDILGSYYEYGIVDAKNLSNKKIERNTCVTIVDNSYSEGNYINIKPYDGTTKDYGIAVNSIAGNGRGSVAIDGIHWVHALNLSDKRYNYLSPDYTSGVLTSTPSGKIKIKARKENGLCLVSFCNDIEYNGSFKVAVSRNSPHGTSDKIEEEGDYIIPPIGEGSGFLFVTPSWFKIKSAMPGILGFNGSDLISYKLGSCENDNEIPIPNSPNTETPSNEKNPVKKEMAYSGNSSDSARIEVFDGLSPNGKYCGVINYGGKTFLVNSASFPLNQGYIYCIFNGENGTLAFSSNVIEQAELLHCVMIARIESINGALCVSQEHHGSISFPYSRETMTNLFSSIFNRLLGFRKTVTQGV